MRIALLLPVLGALTVACRSSDDTARNALDSARAANAPPGLTGAPSTPTLGGACSAMARISRGTLRMAIGRDRATSFLAPSQATGTWRGCRLVGNGTVPADSATNTPDALLQPALLHEGWTLDPKFSAKSADASQFAVRRATALCVLTTSYQNPGVTAKAPASPAAALAQARPYRIEIRCTDSVPA